MIRMFFALALLPLQAFAWDEQRVLEFIVANNPVLHSYRTVGAEYRPPAETLDRLIEYTSIYGKAGLGGTDYQDSGVVLQAGVQIAIPLASTRERRDFALKAQEEVRAIDQVKAKVVADIVRLREHEADLAATERRIEFYGDKSGWLQQRVKDGFDDVAALWDIGQKLNEERAASDKLTILVGSQRYQLAQHAGDQWQVLLAYLEGAGELGDQVAQR